MKPFVKKFNIKGFIIDALMFLLGSLLFAASVNVFTAPNNIAPGGITGAATMINFVFNFPIGISIILLNIPIFIWAFIETNFHYIFKTLIATLMSSIAVDLTKSIFIPFTSDLLLASLFGGVIGGLGLGLIFMRGATTGGTDIIASLINKHMRHMSLGRLVLYVDLVIILMSVFVYKNYESPMYSIVSIFVFTKFIDAVLYGTNRGTGKMLFIVSKKSKEIKEAIITKIQRGVTELKSRGGYSGVDGEVLLCAVRRQQVYQAYDIVEELDPDAFIIVGNAEEINGKGFLKS